MDGEELHDLIDSLSAVPLPAPTTVTNRSLRPRRGRSQSSRSSSRSTTASTYSRSSSVIHSQTTTNASDMPREWGFPGEDPAEVKEDDTYLPGLSEKRIASGSGHGDDSRKRPRMAFEVEERIAGPSNLNPQMEGERTRKKPRKDADTAVMENILVDADSQEGIAGATRAILSESLQPSTGDAQSLGFIRAPSHDLVQSTVQATVQAGIEFITGPSGTQLLEGEEHATSSALTQQRVSPNDVHAVEDSSCPVDPPTSIYDALVTNSKAKRLHTTSDISVAFASPFSSVETSIPTNSPVQTKEPLSAYPCPICFSPPTNATLTPCGHICCGECLFTAVKTTMQRATYAGPAYERITAR